MPDGAPDQAGRDVVVALDLMGGDDAPGAVVDGALLVRAEQPGVEVVLVGPPDVAATALAERGAADAFRVVAAHEVVGMSEDPARGVRAKRDATVRVAARLVRDGEADAAVSVGSTGAAMAAALFTLGRLPGVTRPPLAVVVPALAGPVVLLDAGATVEADPALLCQFALCGAAFAQARLGLERPRVGLLSVGSEDGKGDPLRKEALAALRALAEQVDGLDVVGNVEGHDVALGGRCDVVVTDGFTGNVLLKGLEGAARMVGAALAAAFTATDERRAAARSLAPALAEVGLSMSPEHLGGGVLLGVGGIAIIGHGSSSPRAVAACVEVAARCAREDLQPRLAASLELLVQARRERAGLTLPPSSQTSPSTAPDLELPA